MGPRLKVSSKRLGKRGMKSASPWLMLTGIHGDFTVRLVHSAICFCRQEMIIKWMTISLAVQGPVVQSMVSLMSLLRGQLVKGFTTLYQMYQNLKKKKKKKREELLPCKPLYNQIYLYFLFKKWEERLQCKSFSNFFNKKYWHIWNISLLYIL